MPEELFCQSMVEIGNGHPLPGGIPTAPGTKGVDMWMKSCRFPECLYDGDHAWPKAFFFEGGDGHKLSNRLVGASGELTEELAMVEKVDSEHLRDGENPHCVRDVLEDFIVEEGGECGGSFGVTRGTDVPLTT